MFKIRLGTPHSTPECLGSPFYTGVSRLPILHRSVRAPHSTLESPGLPILRLECPGSPFYTGVSGVLILYWSVWAFHSTPECLGSSFCSEVFGLQSKFQFQLPTNVHLVRQQVMARLQLCCMCRRSQLAVTF